MPHLDVRITSIGSVSGLIAKALSTYGHDPVTVMVECGIDPAVLHDPEARVRMDLMQVLWRRAVELTGDSSFGLTVSEQFQPAAMHGLGFAWLASDTLRDAFNRLIRFSRFLNPLLEVRLEEHEMSTDIILSKQANPVALANEAADCGMAMLLRMCRLTVGDHVAPMRTAMQRSAPDAIQRFEEMFGTALDFDSGDNRFSFDPQLVDQRLTTGNPNLARINDQTVIDYLARFDRANFSMRVRALIIERLPSGNPDQQSIAQELHTSRRSLQRRLSNEGTTFNALLEDARRELAVRYLGEQHRSVGEVTYLLGFSEPSNFTRAFRRWMGVSPMAFRSQFGDARQDADGA